MSFKVKCENCDNALDKVFDALSIYRGIMSGGIVECKNCKARYKSKYKTSFFEGLVPLDIVVLPIYIWLLLYFDDWAISLIAYIVVYQCFSLGGAYFMPLRRIDKSDEEFWDIKQKD